MNIIELFDELKKHEIGISLKEDDRLSLSFNGQIPEHILNELRAQKQEVVALLKGKKQMPISKVGEQSAYELSDHQRRIWILSQLYEGGSSAYNIYEAHTFSGSFDILLLTKAFERVVERHEILRTVFREGADGRPQQSVLDFTDAKFVVEIHDIRDQGESGDMVNAFIKEDSLNVFDLENGPLLRVHLFQTKEEELVVYINIHHIVADAWSLGVLFKDVEKIYEGLLTNGATGLEPLRIQYKDYANHQLQQLKSEKMDKMRVYWLKRFEDGVPNFDLPFSKKRPEMKTFNGYRMEYNFTKELTVDLKRFCKENNGTLFSALLASIKSLFYRYSGQSDIVVGSPITSRKDAELENQIGFYGNTLALRTIFNGTDSFLEVCQKVNESVLGASENGEYPFIHLVDDLEIERDSSRNPLVNILVALQNEIGFSTITSINDDEIDCVVRRGKVLTRLDIDFSFEEFGDNLNMLIEFNSNLYDSTFIEKFILNYKKFLVEALKSPCSSIDDIQFLTTEETNLIKGFSEGKQVPFNKGSSILDHFYEQCDKSGEAIALEYANGYLSYRQLNEKSNQLAHFLTEEKNVSFGDKVILQLEKSNWHVLAQLAILKLKSAYIPLACDYPTDKLESIKETNGVSFILNQSVITEFLESGENNWSLSSLNVEITGEDLAYVMYTSGTTGNPKGVMISHANINRLALEGDFCPLNNETVILSTASFSFDAATFEVYGTLLNGGKLVIANEGLILDASEMAKTIKDYSINTMWLTNGWLNQLVDMDSCVFEKLKYLICGGEALHANRIIKLKTIYPNLVIVNGYGPTENCTFSVTAKCSEIEFESNVPIGIPLNNATAYIMDEKLNLVPFGGQGEICLGGTGLSSGYFGNEKLTEEKFVNHPFVEGEKLYRSGDLGRFRNDGQIEYLGRKDCQFKIRGFRVELEEIEEAISKQHGVENAVVVVNENNNNELVAFITTSFCSVVSSKVLEFAAELIPSYMVPNRLVKVEEIPLTKNGKVDRKYFLKQVSNVMNCEEIIPPSNETEELLLKLWQEVLEIEEISVKRSFFEVGGNSILLIDLTSKLSAHFDITYSSLGKYVNDFTISELANNLVRLEVEKINMQ